MIFTNDSNSCHSLSIYYVRGTLDMLLCLIFPTILWKWHDQLHSIDDTCVFRDLAEAESTSRLVSKAHPINHYTLLTLPSDRDLQGSSEELLWFVILMFVWFPGAASENPWSSWNWKGWAENNVRPLSHQSHFQVIWHFPLHHCIGSPCHPHDSISMPRWWHWGSRLRDLLRKSRNVTRDCRSGLGHLLLDCLQGSPQRQEDGGRTLLDYLLNCPLEFLSSHFASRFISLLLSSLIFKMWPAFTHCMLLQW